MPKFRVYALSKDNPAKPPGWQDEVVAYLIGEALEQGAILFDAHCKKHRLDPNLFELRAGTP
jgi:hypothetical protein